MKRFSPQDVPNAPGVYIVRDAAGGVIYVGKAKSLRRRLSSYFQPSRGRTADPKLRALIHSSAEYEIRRTRTEGEALLLESQLVKEFSPRYNVDLRDDKRFLLVRVDPGEELPRFRLTRIKKDDRSRYFGPFAHSSLLRKTLAQLRRQFGVLLGDAEGAPEGAGASMAPEDPSSDETMLLPQSTPDLG